MNDKKKIIGLSIFCVLIIAIFGVNIVLKHTVTIVDQTRTITVNSLAQSVGEVLEQANIELRAEDEVSCALDTRTENGQVITINRSEAVTIVDGNNVQEIYSTSSNIGQILDEAGLTVSEDDKVYPGLSSLITADRRIEIVRVDVSFETTTLDIPAISVVKRTTAIDPGKSVVEQSGVSGSKQVTYKIVKENGIEVSRRVDSEVVKVEPVTEVIALGAEKLFITSRGMPFRYTSSFIVEATAYDLSYASCGKYPDHPEYGITYSGTRARPGAIAVDPKIIPLGTKLYVQSLDYTDDYGFSSAEDTGSAIKGYRVDLFIESNYDALRYGRRNVRVYILDENIDNSLIKGYSN